MHTLKLICFVFFSLLLLTPSNAQDIVDDCSEKEINRQRILGVDGIINNSKEARLYSLHKNNEMFRCFDNDFNGQIEGAEIEQVVAYLNTNVPESDAVNRDRLTYRQRFRSGDPFTTEELIEREAQQDTRPDRGLYIANSKFDLQSYSVGQRKNMKGATVSFQDNRETGVQTGKLKGTVGYRIDLSNYRGSSTIEQAALDSGTTKFYDVFAAPRVSFDGEINTTQDEESSLVAALDTGLHINNVLGFDHQYFLLSPYYQTDFRFEAQAYGMELAWEPYLLDWRLGYYFPRSTKIPSIFDGYWRLNLIADALSVDDAGKTSLTSDEEYVWLGATAAAYWLPYQSFFSDKSLSPFGIAQYSYFWDAVSQQNIALYEATLGLNLNREGTAAITLGYNYGKDKSDLVQKNEFNLGFNVKY